MSGQLNRRKDRNGEANRWIFATFCCKSVRKCLKYLHDKLCHLYFFSVIYGWKWSAHCTLTYCTQYRVGSITVDEKTPCIYVGAYKHMLIWQLGLDATKWSSLLGMSLRFGRALWDLWRLSSCEVWGCVSNLTDLICKVNIKDTAQTFSCMIDLGHEIDCCSVKNFWLLNAEQKWNSYDWWSRFKENSHSAYGPLARVSLFSWRYHLRSFI
jgi:hypothetical protein